MWREHVKVTKVFRRLSLAFYSPFGRQIRFVFTQLRNPRSCYMLSPQKSHHKYTCKAKQKTSHKNRTDEKKIIRKYTPYNIFVENLVYKKTLWWKSFASFLYYIWLNANEVRIHTFFLRTTVFSCVHSNPPLHHHHPSSSSHSSFIKTTFQKFFWTFHQVFNLNIFSPNQ